MGPEAEAGIYGGAREMMDSDIDSFLTYWYGIAEEMGVLHSTWSCFEGGQNADAVGIEGRNLTLVYDEDRPVRIALPDNPTWRQLFVAADKLIGQSGDTDHIFIESFETKESDVYLHTGS